VISILAIAVLSLTAVDVPAPATLEAQTEALRNASSAELLARGRAAVAALGAYRVRSTVEERIKGKLQDPQTLQMWVREQPFAVRVEYLTGHAQGRKVFYDAQTRPGDVRVKESGFLGIVGALWISTKSSLVYGDTNHPITDVGLGAILRIQSADIEKAKAFGGYKRTDVGLNERGRYCIQYDAPPSATGLYATRSLICLDPATALPLEVTDWDQKGLLERFIFRALEPHAAEGPDVFTTKAAGL
jgi:hypothetical protein